MAKYNEIVNLITDACRGRVSNYAAADAKYTDEAIRQAFYEILGDDKLTYKNWRRHKVDIFEIMEDVINTNLPDAWNESSFYREMVEVKNLALGDKNEFIVEDNSTLIVSRFAGNHWDTDRQKLIGKKSFSLPTEWFYIRVYDELERFLKGIVTIEQMFSKLREGLQKDIDGRIYSAFIGAGTYLPPQFVENGAVSKDNMLALVDRVQTATGKTARITGTKQGLASLGGVIDANWVSENMRNEQHTTGRIKIWEGINTLEIPQVFQRGTYDFKINDKALYVLPETYRPIKLLFEGDTRARDLNEQDNMDMTLDSQLQTKLGIGIIFEDLFGAYNIL